MAEALKEIFNAAAVGWLTERLSAAWPDFPAAKFKKAILADLPSLELKPRVERIALEMQRQLPPDFRKSVKIVTKALGAPPPAGTSGAAAGDAASDAAPASGVASGVPAAESDRAAIGAGAAIGDPAK